jgi:hypothetical protein
VASSCKPGWGYGDKNHCHSGPPGSEPSASGPGHKSLISELIDYRKTSTGRGLLFALAAALSLMALFLVTPRRRHG